MRVTRNYLAQRRAEYEAIRAEIDELKKEMGEQ